MRKKKRTNKTNKNLKKVLLFTSSISCALAIILTISIKKITKKTATPDKTVKTAKIIAKNVEVRDATILKTKIIEPKVILPEPKLPEPKKISPKIKDILPEPMPKKLIKQKKFTKIKVAKTRRKPRKTYVKPTKKSVKKITVVPMRVAPRRVAPKKTISTKEEAEAFIGKLIDRLRYKKDESKYITKEEWKLARAKYDLIPEFRPKFKYLFEMDRRKVLELAKRLDDIKSKLYSKHKFIRKDEWKRAKSARLLLRHYDENLAKILKKDRQYVIKIAKEIDTAMKGSPSGKATASILHKLPGYKAPA